MRPTMSDVAHAAGVSTMTVSNVLTGRRRVSTQTRTRVERAAADLGYELNLTARHLRAGRTHTVALAVPFFDHPYFGELAARLARLLAPEGRHLVVEQTGPSREAELAAVTRARWQLYDGVLLSVVGMTAADLDDLRTSVPLVLLGEQQMPARYDHVRMDNVGGARLATAHLLATGARRIAVVGGAEPSADAGMMPARTLGWALAHEDAGVAVEPGLVVRAPADLASGREAVRRIVRDGIAFDAVLAVTDTLAAGVLAGLAEAGLRVPDDVQVVGFDNLASSELTVPALSTVDPGHEHLATEALRLLDVAVARGPGRGADGAADAPRHVTAPAELVLRATTRERRG
ncbi:LacI family transcriptional regulator [Isoptericola sp. S6320L]|uniref:LacI family DNA-binding transcriptional regulator n=1 Tax=Isoptericola sp. S6320L TaxID=2926411 RepID=UPI001FF23960|nr:LacI family DNA-binding transcriptional regulator [Isoptericola sp. S6320L]MCK0117744.1 LacI family transcriptional regulator [Isoptericola sp. S6320L]